MSGGGGGRLAYKICSARRDSFVPCLAVLEVSSRARSVATQFSEDGLREIAIRCEWVKVRAVYALDPENGDIGEPLPCGYSSFSAPVICYQPGKRVWVRDFDERSYMASSTGIHCYVDQIEARKAYFGAGSAPRIIRKDKKV